MSEQRSPERESQTALTRPTLLVIDDDPGVRCALEAVLSSGGFRVRTAATGEEGTKLYRQERVAMVLVDMVLPGQDGVETIMDIRRSFPAARMVAMSSALNHEMLALARKVGAAQCLTKPFSRQSVLEAVRSAFHDKRSGPVSSPAE